MNKNGKDSLVAEAVFFETVSDLYAGEQSARIHGRENGRAAHSFFVKHIMRLVSSKPVFR